MTANKDAEKYNTQGGQQVQLHVTHCRRHAGAIGAYNYCLLRAVIVGLAVDISSPSPSLVPIGAIAVASQVHGASPGTDDYARADQSDVDRD